MPARRRTAPRTRTRTDAGFTMVEVMVTISLLTTVMGFAVAGWSGWSRAHEHRSTLTDLQSTLRHAQQRAVTDGGPVCVRFDLAADTWRLERGACTSTPGPVLGGPWEVARNLDLQDAAFTHADGTRPALTFTSRGTATPGRVEVRREDTGRVRRVTVEGLTGRVAGG